MSTRVATLSVPVGGTSTAVSVSDLDVDKFAITVAERADFGRIVLEGSGDGGTTYAPFAVIGIVEESSPLQIPYQFTHIRARRMSGAGLVTIYIAGTVVTNVFYTAIDLTPRSISTVASSPVKTIVVTGSYSPPLIIEGSQDGVGFDPVATLLTGGAEVASLPEGVLLYLKARVQSGSIPNITACGQFPSSSDLGVLQLTNPITSAQIDTGSYRKFLVPQQTASIAAFPIPTGTEDGREIVFRFSGQAVPGTYTIAFTGGAGGYEFANDNGAGVTAAQFNNMYAAAPDGSTFNLKWEYQEAADLWRAIGLSGWYTA